LGDLSFVASAAAWTLTAQAAAPRFFNSMPQRFLRPTIRQSKRWNRLPWEAQSLFIRLLTLVDDFGRYEADPELLRSEAFPFGDPCGQMITVENICLQLQSLVSKNMIVLYTVNDVSYLQLTRWNERARAEKSRFPPPPEHLLSDVSKCLLPSPSPSSSTSGEARARATPPVPLHEKISFERELKDINIELAGNGKLNDYPKDSKKYNRVKTLINRQAELREILGVVA
jgi:hypothetical protein